MYFTKVTVNKFRKFCASIENLMIKELTIAAYFPLNNNSQLLHHGTEMRSLEIMIP